MMLQYGQTLIFYFNTSLKNENIMQIWARVIHYTYNTQSQHDN